MGMFFEAYFLREFESNAHFRCETGGLCKLCRLEGESSCTDTATAPPSPGNVHTIRNRLLVCALLLTASRGVPGQAGPIPPPAPPAGPSVILTSHALDGEGGTLRNARIGIANGRITSLAAPSVGAQPPQAAP